MTDTDAAEAAPLPTRPARDAAVAIEVLVVLALAVVPNVIGSFTPRPEGFKYTISLLAAQCISRAVSVVSVLLYLIWRGRRPWKDFGIVRYRFFSDVLGAIGVIALLYCGRWVTFMAIRYALGLRLYAQLARHAVAPSSVFLGPRSWLDYSLLIVGQLANALTEELSMRGYLIVRFEQLFRSTPRALILSTLLFAFYHAYQGTVGIINAFAIGLVLGILFCRFRRIWPLVLAHAAFDIIIFLQLPSR